MVDNNSFLILIGLFRFAYKDNILFSISISQSTKWADINTMPAHFS